MIEVRNNFSAGMNMDDSRYALPQNCYIDSLNITLDAIAFNEDRIVSNVVGNRLISSDLPDGDNYCIGSIANTLRGTLIAFIYNSDGFHQIVEYNVNARTSEVLFENLTDSGDIDVLGFTLNGKISSVNILNRDEGDLVFFVDSLLRPTYFNIEYLRDEIYTPVTRQIIDVATNWPSVPPTCIYGNDATTTSNYLQKKLFRFKYRWVYDDNFKSPFSPISAVALPANILDTEFTNEITNNNFITVSIQSGHKNVKGIELAVSVQNNSNVFGRFQEVTYFDKEVETIDDDTSFAYEFYNDGTYAFVSDEESLLQFSYVPQKAVAQEMPNGNILAYGAITEGYDRDLDANVEIAVNTVPAGEGTSVGSLNGVVNSPAGVFVSITFSGVPAVGTVVNVYILVGGSVNTLAGTYTTQSGDTSSSVATGLEASIDGIGVAVASSSGDVLTIVMSPADDFGSLEIDPPASSANDNSIATWPFWGQRRLGIQYYDEKGRTNGVLYDVGLTFPSYNENGSGQVLLPFINVKIYHVPPIWAYTYQIVFTKDVTPFLYIETIDVIISDSDFLYFEITNLAINAAKNPTTAAVVSWTFQDGDRMRLVRRMSDGFVFSGNDFQTRIEGIVNSPTISNITYTDRTFVKIPNEAPFTAETYTSDFFIIQLYRPTLQEPNDENATFYECAVQYPILNPTENGRLHGGEVTDQSSDYSVPAEINIYSGDVYFRSRNEYLSETGIGTFNVQDRNFVDTFISAVSNLDGRPTVIDINAKETFFPATIRFSQAYQANTNINGLNIFYPSNFEDCDYSYGTIQRLKTRARFMRVYQQLRVGVIYLFSKISKNPTGDEILVVTDQLLNPIQYYNYDTGIGDLKDSLASFNDADYFCSNITGGIYRASLDGITPLHIIYKMNSWSTLYMPLRNSNFHVYGSYDQRLNNYVIALEAAPLKGSVSIRVQGKISTGFFNNKYIAAYVGTPNTGDILSIYLIDGDSEERTYSYTCVNGDTLNNAVSGLMDAINNDTIFTAIINTAFLPDVGIVVSQVTGSNPELFTGLASIEYTSISESPATTLSFSEDKDPISARPYFESFLSFNPENMVAIGTTFISFLNGDCWTHDSEDFNTFYGTSYNSEATVVFNDKSAFKKMPISITENASHTWDCPEIISQVKSYGSTNQQTSLVEAEFIDLESTFSASIKRDANSTGGKINGDFMKGAWIQIKFRRQNATEITTLESVILTYKESFLNTR